MMPAPPTATLEMIQPQLFFHLLIILLDPVPALRYPHQPPHARLAGQIAEKIFGRLRLTRRPLDEQPDVLARQRAELPVLCRLQAARPEAGAHGSLGALPPGHWAELV